MIIMSIKIQCDKTFMDQFGQQAVSDSYSPAMDPSTNLKRLTNILQLINHFYLKNIQLNHTDMHHLLNQLSNLDSQNSLVADSSKNDIESVILCCCALLIRAKFRPMLIFTRDHLYLAIRLQDYFINFLTEKKGIFYQSETEQYKFKKIIRSEENTVLTDIWNFLTAPAGQTIICQKNTPPYEDVQNNTVFALDFCIYNQTDDYRKMLDIKTSTLSLPVFSPETVPMMQTILPMIDRRLIHLSDMPVEAWAVSDIIANISYPKIELSGKTIVDQYQLAADAAANLLYYYSSYHNHKIIILAKDKNKIKNAFQKIDLEEYIAEFPHSLTVSDCSPVDNDWKDIIESFLRDSHDLQLNYETKKPEYNHKSVAEIFEEVSKKKQVISTLESEYHQISENDAPFFAEISLSAIKNLINESMVEQLKEYLDAFHHAEVIVPFKKDGQNVDWKFQFAKYRKWIDHTLRPKLETIDECDRELKLNLNEFKSALEIQDERLLDDCRHLILTCCLELNQYPKNPALTNPSSSFTEYRKYQKFLETYHLNEEDILQMMNTFQPNIQEALQQIQNQHYETAIFNKRKSAVQELKKYANHIFEIKNQAVNDEELIDFFSDIVFYHQNIQMENRKIYQKMIQLFDDYIYSNTFYAQKEIAEKYMSFNISSAPLEQVISLAAKSQLNQTHSLVKAAQNYYQSIQHFERALEDFLTVLEIKSDYDVCSQKTEIAGIVNPLVQFFSDTKLQIYQDLYNEWNEAGYTALLDLIEQTINDKQDDQKMLDSFHQKILWHNIQYYQNDINRYSKILKDYQKAQKEYQESLELARQIMLSVVQNHIVKYKNAPLILSFDDISDFLKQDFEQDLFYSIFILEGEELPENNTLEKINHDFNHVVIFRNENTDKQLEIKGVIPEGTD